MGRQTGTVFEQRLKAESLGGHTATKPRTARVANNSTEQILLLSVELCTTQRRMMMTFTSFCHLKTRIKQAHLIRRPPIDAREDSPSRPVQWGGGRLLEFTL